MSTTASKEAARSYFERFVNHGDMAVADMIFAPDVRFHYPLGELGDVDAGRRYIAAVRPAFPDIRFTIDDLFGEGERVAVRWSLVGTQTGEFRGKPPTGKQVKLPGNTILRVQDGMIREMWIAFNPTLLL